MKTFKLLWFVAVASIFAVNGLFALDVSSGDIVPGEWNYSFSKGKAYADANNVPMLVFWGNVGCGNCGNLRRSCNSEDFIEWQTDRKIVMVFDETPNSSAKNFAKNSSGKFPYICVYWLREDGTATTNRFSGLRASMPAPSSENGVDRSLGMQLAASVDLFIEGYNVSDYEGGEFKTSVNEGNRLEAIPGKTAYVDVPLVRHMANAENDAHTLLVATMPDGTAVTNEVEWQAGGVSQSVRVEIPETLATGGEITLALVDDKGKSRAESVIALVEEPENSVRNPLWLTDEFEFGKWTFDYAAATNAVQKERDQGRKAYTLAMFTGTLWCPYCKGMEGSLLASGEFKDWAASNNVALVIFDQGRASSPSTPAGTEEARLLTYVGDSRLDADEASTGAGYLSRKMISDEDAASVMELTTELTSRWLAPGSTAARLGNPTLLLIEDGDVVGRFSFCRDAQRNYDPEENLGRLEDFLALAERDSESSDFSGTTELVHQVGEESVSTFQISDRKDYFKLEGVAAGRLSVVLNDGEGASDVKIALLQNGEILATGTNMLAATVSSATAVLGDFMLEVSAYQDTSVMLFNPATGEGVETTVFDVSFSSSQVLVPEERSAQFTPQVSSLKMEVSAGVSYKLSGFTEESLADNFTASEDNAGVYTAKAGGTIDLGCTIGGEVTYQLWKPGVFSFASASMELNEKETEVQIKLVRKGGASGAVSMMVSLTNGAEVAENRFTWNDCLVNWADGDSSDKSVVLRIHDDTIFDDDQTLRFALALASGEGVQVGTDSFALTIRENDKKVVGKLKISETDPVMSKKMAAIVPEGSTVAISVSRVNGAEGVVSGILSASAGAFTGEDSDSCVLTWSNRDVEPVKTAELTLPTLAECPSGKVTVRLAGKGISVDSQARTLTISLIADGAPRFKVEEMTISDLVSNVSFERVLAVDPNTLEGGNAIKVSKISGTQPAGIKASVNAGDAEFVLSGVPTKAGEYQAFYRVSQVRNGKTVVGGVVKVSFVISELSKGDNPVNPSVAKAFTVKNVPVFASALKRMTGLLTLTVPPTGRLSAKYICAEGTVSLSCTSWAECDENGTLKAQLRSRNSEYSLSVSVTSSGAVSAEFFDPSWPGDTITATAQSGDLWSKDNSAADWKGLYTMALIPTELSGSESILSSGSAGFSVKLMSSSALRNGTVSYAGFLPNGTSVSGSAVLWKSDDGQSAILPVFKVSSTDLLSAAAKITKGAAALYEAEGDSDPTVQRVINAVDGVDSFWRYTNRKTEVGDFDVKFRAYGSYYVSKGNIEDGLMKTGVMPRMKFTVGTGELGPSAIYGDADDAPECAIRASGDDLDSESADVKLSFAKSTGLVSGSFKLPFEKKDVSVKYRAVVLPGWTGCGCEDRTDLPFIVGSCWFDDTFQYQSDWDSCSESTAPFINVRFKRGCGIFAETVPYTE